MRAVLNTAMKIWLSQNVVNTDSPRFIALLRKLLTLRAELNLAVVTCLCCLSMGGHCRK